MDKRLYYPALFFKDIVEYYGGSETRIEELMRENISVEKANILAKLRDALQDLRELSYSDNTPYSERPGSGILKDIEKIKPGGKEVKIIAQIRKITDRVKNMNEIDAEVYNRIIQNIQAISENEGITGYSDTNIRRYMCSDNNILSEENYNHIVDYLIQPQEQNDFTALTARLFDCIISDKYKDIPEKEMELIKNYLTRSDFTHKYILRIFRILQGCSYGFSESEKKDSENKVKFKITESISLEERIMKALQSMWGEIEAEGVGISNQEKQKILYEVQQKLLKDHKFYHTDITADDKENSKGFLALMFYRLCNYIFYYTTNQHTYNGESDDIQKSMAFFAFSILQRAVEHTEIFLHPAAQLEYPVYIGERVLVGKQCYIGPGCVLGNDVCLYPFNTYNINERHNTYIIVHENTVFLKNTRIMGCITIGRNCIIDKTILIGNDVDDGMYIGNNEIKKVDDEKRHETVVKVMEGIL